MSEERLGRYRLLEPLGEGGMGRVHAAELEGPAGFRKRVAVKVLTGGSVEGLVREARLGGLLRHPNLVEVYALEQDGDDWFVAMELVPGGSLSGKGPLSPRAVVDIGLQVCAGLEHAHRQIGLVHLDLKPSNLLLDGGTVKIADLGIARARGFEAEGIRGTPAYMAPEQLAGAPVDARTDVFALGVVLRNLAVGPRDRGSADTWSTVPDLGPEGPRPQPRDVPGWLAPVVERCTALDPADRYQSAAELADALRALDVSGEGIGRVSGAAVEVPTTGPTARTNLEPLGDRFVGRGAELDTLDAHFERWRVVSLKGLGGMGKTRLAREYGLRRVERGQGEAWFCDLSEARTALEGLGAVAAVLQVPLGRGESEALTEQLGRALAGRGPMLLILDNLEQLADFGPVVQRWLEQAPALSVLATTREPLRLRGERVVELEPLPLADAAELLVERAAARGRQVELDADLEELARRLDGLPLALELAAGRLGLLSAAQIGARLDQRLDLLRTRRPDAPERQATLRGMVDWSWQLLGPEERSALAQLSVFRGGFDLESAEAVIALDLGAPWAMDLVEQLVDHSLVLARQGAGGPRFAMYETVRTYAAEHLESEARREAEARHGAWFARFAWRQARMEMDRGDGVGRAMLAENLENLVAGLQRARRAGRWEEAGDLALAAWEVWMRNGPARAALEPIGGLFDETRSVGGPAGNTAAMVWGQVLHRHGRAVEALAVLRSAVEDAPTDSLKLTSMLQLGVVLGTSGDPPEAEAVQREAVALAERIGDRKRKGVVLGSLGLNAMRRGALGEARERFEASLAIHLDLGNRRSEAVVRGHLGILAYEQGRIREASAHFERALGMASRWDPSRAAILRQNLAQVELELGDFASASRRLERARTTQRQVGNVRSEAIAVVTLGALELRRGASVQARERLAEGRELAEGASARMWVAIADGWTGVLHLEGGDAAEARDLLEGAISVLERGLKQAAGFFRAQLGRSWLDEDRARGRALLDRAVEDLRGGGFGIDLARVLVLRAERLGDVESLREAEARIEAMELPPEAPLARALVAAQTALAG